MEPSDLVPVSRPSLRWSPHQQTQTAGCAVVGPIQDVLNGGLQAWQVHLSVTSMASCASPPTILFPDAMDHIISRFWVYFTLSTKSTGEAGTVAH